MAVTEFIRNKRKEKKLSQAQLAELVGVGRRTLQYWENGTSVMPVDKADEMLRVLGETYTLGKVL